jgi:pimeloyl-ACP methyl ester carboxylesterase
VFHFLYGRTYGADASGDTLNAHPTDPRRRRVRFTRLDRQRPSLLTEDLEAAMNSAIATKTMVLVDDAVQICVETIGDRGAPPILLIGGATWSMDWWDDELCGRLADRGRLVVRYDNRDTGRSTTYPPGAPGYTGADMVTDAIAVLEGLGIERAHVVGLSMGGGIAQDLALEHRDRMITLTLMSTSPLDPGIEGLPGMAPELQATFANESPEPDWDDRDAVVDHIVEGERPYAGPGNFDESRIRALAERVFDRSNDIGASLTNHFLAATADEGPRNGRLSELHGLPTLVLHGSADPLFPPAHGRALADAIPGARLIELDRVGHQLPPPHTWDLLVDELIEHTRET